MFFLWISGVPCQTLSFVSDLLLGRGESKGRQVDSEITKGFSFQMLGKSYIGNFRRAIYGRGRNMRRRCVYTISGGQDTFVFQEFVRVRHESSFCKSIDLTGGYNMCVE